MIRRAPGSTRFPYTTLFRSAIEKKLERRVVIKVLPDDVAAAISVERFRREIHVAAALQHPHIVPVLSAGEIANRRSEEHTSELQSRLHLVCRLLLDKNNH